MPNWCNNSIRITGNPRTIRIITETIQRCQVGTTDEETRLFTNLVGYPTHMTKKETDEDWYNLNIDWFGTKWDVDCQSIDFDFYEDEIIFNAETAWSPPIGFLTNLVKQYEGIEAYIFYTEGGCDFTGETNIYRNSEGEVMVDDKCYHYLEGLYIIDRDYFWVEVEYTIDNIYDVLSMDVENLKDNVTDQMIDDYIDDYFSFIEGRDRKEIFETAKQTLYEQIKCNESNRTEEQTIPE